MATQSTLEILIQLKDEATEGMKKFSSSFKEAEGASKAFGIGVAAAATAVVAFGYESVKAAGEAQAKIASMDATLKTMGDSAVANRDQLLKMADGAVKLGFEEDDAAVSLAKLYQRTNDLSEAQRLNSIAMDLARAKHMDLSTAANMVGLVMSGNGRVLKQFGIDLKEAGTPMEALSELQGKLAGQAQAYADTYEGQMAVLQASTKQFQEEVGRYLLPVLTNMLKAITPILHGLMEWASNLSNLKKFLDEHKVVLMAIVGAIVGGLTPALIGLAITILTVTIPAFIAAAVALAPFLIGGAIIGGLVAGILWIVENWTLVKDKTLEVWTAITTYLTGVWTAITTTITAAWNGIKIFFSTIWEIIKDIFTFGADLATGAAINIFAAFGIDIVGVFTKIKVFFDTVWTAIKLVFSSALTVIQKNWNTIWQAISAFLNPVWEGMKAVINVAWQTIITMFQEYAAPLKNAWTSLWSALGSALTDVWGGIEQTIKNSINWIIEKINTVIQAMNSVASKGAGVVGAKAPQMPTIPLLAEGGIVTSPTLAMIGEAGPEAVVPLGKSGGFGATNIYITITGNNINKSLDIKNLADQVSIAIVNKLRVNQKFSV